MHQFIASEHKHWGPSIARRTFHYIALLLGLTAVACNGNHSNKEKNMPHDKSNQASDPAAAVAVQPNGDPTASMQALRWYDLKEREPESFELPKKLREISGLAFTADGRLFGHGDERGAIFQIDTADGSIIKQFYIGDDGGIKGDFEDIAIVHDTFYLMGSRGSIFEFKEGDDGATVAYQEYQTFLNNENNVEGLCYDPATNALLLACKYDPGAGYQGYKGVYSFPLATHKLEAKPRLLLSLADLTRETGEDKFNTSAIVHHPKSGTFLLLASSGSAIAEVSADGKVLGALHLKRSIHTQPEGITIGPGLTLWISDEGRDARGRLTKYPMRPTN